MSAPSHDPSVGKSRGVALLAGALFGVGLVVSGMTNPSKVIGFLDIAGAWDPSLAFVMVGAIGVHLVARRFIVDRPSPLAAPRFEEPTRTDVDAPLVVGATLFGVGWALGGYCPGPAIVSIGSGSLDGLLFVATMAVGTRLHDACWPKTLGRLPRLGRARETGPVLSGVDG